MLGMNLYLASAWLRIQELISRSTEQTEHLVEDSLAGESFHDDPDRETEHGHASIQPFGVKNHRIGCGLSWPQRRIRNQQMPDSINVMETLRMLIAVQMCQKQLL